MQFVEMRLMVLTSQQTPIRQTRWQ